MDAQCAQRLRSRRQIDTSRPSDVERRTVVVFTPVASTRNS